VLREGSGATLLLVHSAGGTLLEYRALVASLPEGVRVVGLAPDDDDETPEPTDAGTSLGRRAARYADALVAEGVRSIDVALGWSYGGVLAFEVARALDERGFSPGNVVLLDAYVLDGDAIASASADDPLARHASELRDHRPGRLSAPVTLIVASGSAALADTLAPRWAEVARVDRVDVDATHDSILKPPALARVVDLVARALALPLDPPEPNA